jgi:hypothetical protein
MKCQICQRKTDWDTSVGYEEFLVCNPCFEKLHQVCKETALTMDFIFKCGQVRRDISKSKKE